MCYAAAVQQDFSQRVTLNFRNYFNYNVKGSESLQTNYVTNHINQVLYRPLFSSRRLHFYLHIWDSIRFSNNMLTAEQNHWDLQSVMKQ